MPKNNKKMGTGESKGVSKKVDAPAADKDDDLDDIIAEVLAWDMQQLLCNSSSWPAITTGSSASSNAGPADASTTEMSVSEATINDAVRRDDTAQLKRWGCQGLRVRSVSPMLLAVVTEAKPWSRASVPMSTKQMKKATHP
jgi:hypothetical protein